MSVRLNSTAKISLHSAIAQRVEQRQSARSVDSLDLEIIRLLQADGRASSADIARHLQQPVPVIRRKVADLLSRRIVEVRAVVHPSVLGLRALCLVSVRVKPGYPVSEFAESLRQVHEIDYVAICIGRFQVLVEVVARDVGAMADIVEARIHMADAVDSYEVSPYFNLHYVQPDFTRPMEGVPAVGGRAEPLDGKDIEILAALNCNGREPFRSIGSALGMSESQVRKRVARLVGAGHLRIMGVVSPSVLGFNTNVWIFATPAPGTSPTELADRLTRIPSVTYVAMSAGRWPVLVEAVCRDEADVLRMLEDEVLTIPGILTIETALVRDLYFFDLPLRSNHVPCD